MCINLKIWKFEDGFCIRLHVHMEGVRCRCIDLKNLKMVFAFVWVHTDCVETSRGVCLMHEGYRMDDLKMRLRSMNAFEICRMMVSWLVNEYLGECGLPFFHIQIINSRSWLILRSFRRHGRFLHFQIFTFSHFQIIIFPSHWPVQPNRWNRVNNSSLYQFRWRVFLSTCACSGDL